MTRAHILARMNEMLTRLRSALRTERSVRLAVLFDLEQAEEMPTLLADVLLEGQVVVDRDGLWEGLRARRSEIYAAAQREDRATMERAFAAIDATRERLAAAGTPS